MSSKITQAEPFDHSRLVMIKALLPEDMTITSEVWTTVLRLANSAIFPDHEAFWTEHCDVQGAISAKSGRRLYNRYESERVKWSVRLVRTAYAVGWLAGSRRAEAVAAKALDISETAAGVANLATMLRALFDAVPSLDAVVIKECFPGIASLVDLVCTKAARVNDGLRDVIGGAQ